jgi:hypothetical protein
MAKKRSGLLLKTRKAKEREWKFCLVRDENVNEEIGINQQ